MNVLAIGAHFDDIELGCGGALARHKRRGDNVYAYVATRSGYRNPDKKLVRSDDEAEAEGREAMRRLGVDELYCGAFETLRVEFVDELNVEILRIVEQRRIELAYMHWVGDIHHDHQAVARASMHSCRHVPRVLMYRSNWYQSAETFRGGFYVDISETWDAKEESVKAHASELERNHHRWLQFFRNEVENAGQRIGVKLAEVFEVLKWLE